MRPFRPLLAVAATAALVAGAPASAAPPEGCYGFPSIPSAYLCVVSFTPGGAVPGAGDGSTVTIPAFCAGACYGPFTVPVPGAGPGSGSGQIAVIVYNGQTYVIGTGGGIPPLPPVGIPPLPGFAPCPGRPLAGVSTSPYVCAHYESGPQGVTLYFGTCAGTECTFSLGLPPFGPELQRLLDDPAWLLRCIVTREC